MSNLRKIIVAENVFLIENFLTGSECDNFIRQSEVKGYEFATVETEQGSKRIEHVRNNQRLLLNDKELAQKLWERAMEFIPKRIGNSSAIALNELFRFYKYEKGEQFKKHIDGSFIRSDTEASYYTFMIYLNDEYKGGETTFEDCCIDSKKGMLIIFLHSLPHSGSPVTKGIKYVLRTDIMYRLEIEQ